MSTQSTSPSYAVPTQPLLYAPRTHWDADKEHYIRQNCSYCLHGNYKWAPEPDTGRFFCATCTKTQGFAVAAAIKEAG